MIEPTSGAAPAGNGQAVPAAPDSSGQGGRTEIRALEANRGWGKWAAEIAVVVIGVLLALGAQQTVETLSWNEKVKVLEGAIRAELGNDLGLATELKILHPCVVEYLDILQIAVLDGDVEVIARLNDMGPPLFGRAWPRDTWTAALNGQVADHLPQERFTAYSRAFLRIGVQREFMQAMEDLYPVALSGGFGLPRDPSVTNGQLVAIQRLRSLEARRILIANSLLDEDGHAVSVAASKDYLAEDQTYFTNCNAGLNTIRAMFKQ